MLHNENKSPDLLSHIDHVHLRDSFYFIVHNELRMQKKKKSINHPKLSENYSPQIKQ